VSPPARFSFTQWARWRRCRRSWGYGALDCLAGEATAAMAAGTLAHSVLERFYGLPPSERTPAGLRSAAAAVWAEGRPDGWPPAGSAECAAMRRRAWAAAESVLALEDPRAVAAAGREAVLECDVAGAPFRGVADRVDASGRVVDYKTGRPRGSDSEQVALYWIAASAGGPPAPPPVLFYLGRPARAVEDFDVAERAAGVAARFAAAAGEALGCGASEAVELEASPGFWCRWCVFSSACPEGSRWLSPPPVRGRAA